MCANCGVHVEDESALSCPVCGQTLLPKSIASDRAMQKRPAFVGRFGVAPIPLLVLAAPYIALWTFSPLARQGTILLVLFAIVNLIFRGRLR